MDFIIDAIVEWLKGLLVDGIMGNLDGLFDNVNQSVGEIATQVGTTPADWNAGVFSMIRQISETAILPIAGVILTFVMTYELIQMLIERNNLHDDVCCKTRPFFEQYKATKYSRKFLAEHEADLELYRAAQAEMRSLLGGAKLPKMDVLKEEGRKLTAKKKQLN